MNTVVSGAQNSMTFANTAAQDGLLEVELGKLAEVQGTDAKIRDFGQRMALDHSKANTELQKIAREKRIALNLQLDAEHQAKLNRIKSKTGKEFDQAYAAAMVKAHADAVTLFQQASTASGVDDRLQEFAKATLPALEGHQRMAQTLNP